MRPLKASLFILYCTLAVAILGTVFSHVWRSSHLTSTEQTVLAIGDKLAADDTASLPLIQPDQSQS